MFGITKRILGLAANPLMFVEFERIKCGINVDISNDLDFFMNKVSMEDIRYGQVNLKLQCRRGWNFGEGALVKMHLGLQFFIK